MIWASTSVWRRGLSAGLLTAALAGTAMAGPVVVRSTGPSARAYPVGQRLADTAQINLRAGDSLVLLDARGTRTITGPGSFAAVAAGTRASATQAAGRILANQTGTERRGGAVRGGAPTLEGQSPNLWFLDLSKSGTMCVADPAALRFWRASPSAASRVTVTGGGTTGTVAMPAGAALAEWPKDVPFADGAEYTVAVDGGTPRKIKLVTVPMPTDLEDTASKLIAQGCTTQLDLLIATNAAGGNAG